MVDASDNVTVILVAALLSSEAVTSLIDKEGVSLSVIVTVPVASLIVPADALLIVMVIVSSLSSVLSSVIDTANVLEVSPALNVKVPFFAV